MSSISIPVYPNHKKKKTDTHHHDHHHDHHHGHHHHIHENHWLKAVLGLVWGTGLIVLSIGSFNIPVIAYYVITGLTTLMTLYLGRTVYQSAWNNLLTRKLEKNTLYTISTLTILLVSLVSMFIPSLPMMFEAAPFILGFWHLGEGIEHTLIEKIVQKLDIRDSLPQSISLKDKPNEISIKELKPGDVIIVKKGCIIPVDGIAKQKTFLYTTRFDGYHDVREFEINSNIKSGMRLADNIESLEMEVTQTYEDSYLSVSAKELNKPNSDKTPIEQFTNQVLNYFIPGLLGIALISGITISTFFGPALAVQCVLSVLVSACPCALSLITPLAVKIGIQKASEEGIQFKNKNAFQALADSQIVAFDKNGTLTQGKTEVKSISLGNQYLNKITLLLTHSQHPVAKTITSYIKETYQEKQETINDESLIINFDNSNHSGIKGTINGETFIIGNKNILLSNGISLETPDDDNPENSYTYIVREQKVIGHVILANPLRKDAIETIKQLQLLGKEILIITGDDWESTKKLAKSLDIPERNVYADIKGALAKEEHIQTLRAQGHTVVMIGDALNDALAIKNANAGIAIQSDIGDTETEQHADIVMQKGLLFPIVTAFDISQKTKQNIFQNLALNLFYNAVITVIGAGVLIPLGITLSPILGVALTILESTIVLANVYRFKRQEIMVATTQSNNLAPTSTNQILNTLSLTPNQNNTPQDNPNPKHYSNCIFTTPKDIYDTPYSAIVPGRR